MANFPPKRFWIAVVLILALIGAGIGLGRLFLKRPGEVNQKETQKPVEAINQIPVEKMPYITITPRSDGREVTIVVERLEGGSAVEYELEYEAGPLLQGAFGRIDFAKEKPPVLRNILLGSCSAGGKCSYHENVNGGTLLLRYTNGETNAIKSEWNFQRMGEMEGRFTSRDGKFSFDVGKTGLPSQTVVVISQTIGLPAPVEGTITGGPYLTSLPKGIKVSGKAYTLSLRLSQDNPQTQLWAWTEAGWKTLEATSSGKSLEATVSEPATFVAVVPPTPQ